MTLQQAAFAVEVLRAIFHKSGEKTREGQERQAIMVRWRALYDEAHRQRVNFDSDKSMEQAKAEWLLGYIAKCTGG